MVDTLVSISFKTEHISYVREKSGAISKTGHNLFHYEEDEVVNVIK